MPQKDGKKPMNKFKNNGGAGSSDKTLSIALIVLVALLIATFVMLFVLHVQSTKNDEPKDDDSIPTISNKDNEDKNENKNTTPLYPTSPSCESYKSKSSAGVITLSEEIKSNNTILVELDGYTSLVEKGADKKIYPASMTKVMTLLVICEKVTDLTEKLTVTEEMVKYKEENDGSGENFKAGEALTVKDFIYLIIYDSNTIACQILAEHIAGSEAALVDLMNSKATDLGLTGTHFTNVTGLYNENHYSTCREIAAIMAYAMENPLAKKVLTSFAGYPINIYDGDSDTVLRTLTVYTDWYSGRLKDNPKLKTVTVKGGKTGYVDESGVSLVSYAESSDGKAYINVIVGKPKGEGLSESVSTSEVKYIYNNYAK